jgi:hypothetical protein
MATKKAQVIVVLVSAHDVSTVAATTATGQ